MMVAPAPAASSLFIAGSNDGGTSPCCQQLARAVAALLVQRRMWACCGLLEPAFEAPLGEHHCWRGLSLRSIRMLPSLVHQGGAPMSTTLRRPPAPAPTGMQTAHRQQPQAAAGSTLCTICWLMAHWAQQQQAETHSTKSVWMAAAQH
jgi:hypothetical protein